MTTATLSPATARVKFRMAGGYNFLRNYRVVLEYPNETLSLFSP